MDTPATFSLWPYILFFAALGFIWILWQLMGDVMAEIVKIRPSWERTDKGEDGNMVFEHTSEVFGEKISAHSNEELGEKIIDRLKAEIQGDTGDKRELERKRVQAKLDAKQRL